RVEIKNLNSFRSLLKGVEYEIERQSRVRQAGGRVRQETMGWDEGRSVTVPQRSKEEAHDYRYFPEPDLPRLHVTSEWIDEIRTRMPELPDARRERYTREWGLNAYDAAVITEDRRVADYFEMAVRAGRESGVSPKLIANWLTSELFARLGTEGLVEGRVTPEALVGLIARVADKTISSTLGKMVLDEMIAGGKDADGIIAERDLGQISDRAAIEAAADQVIAENPKPVSDYLAGKEPILKFLVGQLMKATHGKANPGLASEILLEKLRVRKQS
ncbi:MAG: Asp-tRNA(Asn)/Glu-tRNA(Gln) amidotransferase GatCAB subunit B, partial [Rudaea sp.]